MNLRASFATLARSPSVVALAAACGGSEPPARPRRQPPSAAPADTTPPAATPPPADASGAPAAAAEPPPPRAARARATGTSGRTSRSSAWMKAGVMPKMGGLFHDYDRRSTPTRSAASATARARRTAASRCRTRICRSCRRRQPASRSSPPKHPKIFGFMAKQVEPTMASLLGEPRRSTEDAARASAATAATPPPSKRAAGAARQSSTGPGRRRWTPMRSQHRRATAPSRPRYSGAPLHPMLPNLLVRRARRARRRAGAAHRAGVRLRRRRDARGLRRRDRRRRGCRLDLGQGGLRAGRLPGRPRRALPAGAHRRQVVPRRARATSPRVLVRAAVARGPTSRRAGPSWRSWRRPSSAGPSSRRSIWPSCACAALAVHGARALAARTAHRGAARRARGVRDARRRRSPGRRRRCRGCAISAPRWWRGRATAGWCSCSTTTTTRARSTCGCAWAPTARCGPMEIVGVREDTAQSRSTSVRSGVSWCAWSSSFAAGERRATRWRSGC